MATQEHHSLKTEYADKVRADLADNTAQQDGIRAQIETLHAQLAALEADHALLEKMSAALGGTATTVPAPRRATKRAAAAARQETAAAPAKQRGGTKAPAKKTRAAKKSAVQGGGAKAAKAGAAKGPALTEVIHTHLSAQSEPRTAREIAKSLAETNPGRTINDNLVRTTTERLVARSRVDRVKQGATVYYTASKTAEAAPAAIEAAQKATAAAS